MGRNDHYMSIFFLWLMCQPIIEILTQNFGVMGSTHYIKNVMDDPWYLGKFWVGGPDHYRSIFFVYRIYQPIIEIFTGNFQHIILGVYCLHQECHG